MTKYSQLKEIFKKAVANEKADRTVVIDVKINHDRPIPIESLKLDKKLHPEK